MRQIKEMKDNEFKSYGTTNMVPSSIVDDNTENLKGMMYIDDTGNSKFQDDANS
jgi:hypothetical protein